MRRALLVGINTYDLPAANLTSCVADAEAMAELLARHQDKKPNYECRTLLDQMEDGKQITRANLRGACRSLFDYKEQVLLYFAGHGVLTDTGGFLCTADAEPDDWGVPMQEIIDMAVQSPAREILLMLDCCHSGDIANPVTLNSKMRGVNPLAAIREGMTVIAASRDSQAAVEAGGHGLFTAAILDALNGGAADHMGWVTASSIFAYVNRRFGAWGQHPVYKSHTVTVSPVRECAPLIDRLKLHRLTELFPLREFKYKLDPAYEPEDEHGNVQPPIDHDKIEIAKLFKEYRDAGLLRPSDPTQQLYWTARRFGTVELTPRGCEYWWLVNDGKI